MHRGYIKLHRKIVESSFYSDSRMVHLWVHLLMKANHKPAKFMFNNEEVSLNRGQFVTGRKILSAETNMPESKVQRSLEFFQKAGMIEQQTNSRSRLITITYWESYQVSEHPVNSERTTGEQLVDTNKNNNNNKNVNNIEARELAFKDSLIPFVSDYGKETIRAFFDYWTETNKSRSKMKWETEKTWVLGLRIKRWANSSFNSPKVSTHTNIQGTPLKRLEMSDIAKNSARDASILKNINNAKSTKNEDK